MTINPINKNNCNEKNAFEISSSERCLAIPEILEKIFMYSSPSGMGNLSQVNKSINQTAKALQNTEVYPKTYQKILLQIFAHLFKKPTVEIASHFIFLSEKNKISELGILINSAKFNEIDLSSFDNIFLQATREGHEQVINKLIDSSRFEKVSGHSLKEFLHQAIFFGHEQVTKKLIDSPKFNELDIGSFSFVLLQVTDKGYEQLVETLMASPEFNQMGLDSLGEFLRRSAEKGYIQVVKKIIDSDRFEEIHGKDLGAALYQATLHRHEELAMELLNVCHSKESIPASPIRYLTNDWGEAFKYAAQNGLDRFINRMITLGTPLDKIILNQLAASLFLASSEGHLKVVEAIIASSRFQEITQNDLDKAYQGAVSGKHEQLVQSLKRFASWHIRMWSLVKN